MWFLRLLLSAFGNSLALLFFLVVGVLLVAALSGCATCPPGQHAYWSVCISEWDIYSPYYEGNLNDQTNLQEQQKLQQEQGRKLREKKP